MTRTVSSHNCYVVKDDKVLMLHRGLEVPRFPDYWMGPGGRQEPYEDVLESCIAHVKEESGVEIANIKLRVVATHNYPYKNELYLVFIFKADYISGEVKEYSRGEVVWVDKEDLVSLDKIYPDLKYHIPLVFEKNSDLYFTYMEFNEDSEIGKSIIRTANGVLVMNGY